MRHKRYKHGEILLEGKRLINDALSAGAVMKSLFLCDYSDADDFTGIDVPMYHVTRHHMKLWSDVATSPGIMAIFEMPTGNYLQAQSTTIPLTLVCDNIRDPGNMGTIIRLAAAAQCDQVLLPQGCVDIWEPKVLRAAMGCHFRVPLYPNLTWGNTANLLNRDTAAILADVSRTDVSGTDVSPKHSPQIHKQSQHDPGRLVEILNDSRDRDDGEDDIEFESDSDSDSDIESSDYRDNDKLQLYSSIPLKCTPYHDVDFTSRHHTLVICNEAVGPSDEARKLVFDNYGQVVVIPTDDQVQSLNSAMAAAVIMFEARRQLTMVGRQVGRRVSAE